MEDKKFDYEKVNKTYLISLFCCCVILIIWVTIFKCNRVKNLNILVSKVAFLNIHDRFMYQFNNLTIHQLMGDSLMHKILNIIIFIPFTLFLPLFFKRTNILRDLGLTFLFSLLIEVTQLFTALGGFEFIDLVTNTLGGLIGILIFKFSYKHINTKTINKVLLIGLIIFVPVTLFSISFTIYNYNMYVPFFDGTYFNYLF